MTETKRTPKTLGRHDLGGSREPAAGYASPPASRHNSRTSIAIIAVKDPGHNPTGRDRIRAVARLDWLDKERRQNLIPESSLQAAREIERAFDRQERIGGGGQWREGDRVDAATAHEHSIIKGIEWGQDAAGLVDWIRRTVGRENAKILFRLLRDGWNYEQVAAERLKFGERGKGEMALRFRIALEIIAEAKAAHGKERA